LPDKKIKIVEAARLKGFRALAWQGDYLYGSRGYRLQRLRLAGPGINHFDPDEVAFFDPGHWKNTCAANRIFLRLFRLGIHSLKFLPGSGVIAVAAKNIILLEPGQREFRSVFKVRRGTRPLGLAVTPQGAVYWGEYFDNPSRQEVRIYGSPDQGKTWQVVYSFAEKSVRHVHNIIYDAFADCFWVLTGDRDAESKIIRASLDWKNLEIVLEGGQQNRAATLIIQKDFILYATDTPHEQNRIYLLEKKSGLKKEVCLLPGPSMYSAQSGAGLFFSTAAEPGEVYHDHACIFGSRDGTCWEKLIAWEKDRLHPKYFQFGNISLPAGVAPADYLAATGVAVRNEDGNTTIWKIEEY